MKVADYIAGELRAQGVHHVFHMSGGMITFLLDSIGRQEGLQAVSCHHEQSAAFAAEAMARMTGIPGVAMATSGPGATNLLTGIGSCYFDSTPAVFLTGQVNRHEQKKDLLVRQLGFQETDIVSMARPITKGAWQVDDPAQTPALLRRAFATALEGRPGPVLLDIPMDVQRADIAPPDGLVPRQQAPVFLESSRAFIEEIIDALATARRPLILAGGGVRSAGAAEALGQLTSVLSVPVVQSLMAVDAMPFANPLRIGLIGSYGNRWANQALGTCDVLLVMGSRLDVRQTGADTAYFAKNRRIYHVDVDAAEMNNRVSGCITHQAHLRDFLHTAAVLAAGRATPVSAAWLAEIDAWRAQWPDTDELRGIAGINPNAFMHALARASGAAAAFAVDVGQHQMWAAQSLELGPRQRFLTSGGMGSMGFALPASIGTSMAASGPVVVIAGDGGFQLNIQELQTIVRNRLPVKIVIVNNRCQGMVRQFQQSYFHERYHGTLWGYDAPDFQRVGAAYGIDSRAIDQTEQGPQALAWLWDDPRAPALLEVIVDTFANVYPKMAFGRPITDMEPFVKPTDMEGT